MLSSHSTAILVPSLDSKLFYVFIFFLSLQIFYFSLLKATFPAISIFVTLLLFQPNLKPFQIWIQSTTEESQQLSKFLDLGWKWKLYFFDFYSKNKKNCEQFISLTFMLIYCRNMLASLHARIVQPPPLTFTLPLYQFNTRGCPTKIDIKLCLVFYPWGNIYYYYDSA